MPWPRSRRRSVSMVGTATVGLNVLGIGGVYLCAYLAAREGTETRDEALLEEFIRFALPRIWPPCHPQSSPSLGECLPAQAVYVCHRPEP
jgi:hypothetical protein